MVVVSYTFMENLGIMDIAGLHQNILQFMDLYGELQNNGYLLTTLTYLQQLFWFFFMFIFLPGVL